MTLFQFAIRNVRRNPRAYGAYFLSCVFAILVFFTYAMLSFHPDLHTKGYVPLNLLKTLQGTDYLIFGFTFFFILYSMGTFLKGRNKEFGLLKTMGISDQQLVGVVFVENVIMGCTAIVTAVFLGLLLAKLLLFVGATILDIPVELPFYFPTQALAITFESFVPLFVFVSLMSTIFIRNQTILNLLKGTSRPKTPPRASLILVLFAIGCLVFGYRLACTYDGTQPDWTVYIIPVLVVIGTYFLYSQLSVFIIRILQWRRAFYWRGTRLLWLSDLAYRMRDNARLFWLVTTVLSVAFTATGFLAVERARMYTGNLNFPFAMVLTYDGDSAAQAIGEQQRQHLEELLQQYQIHFTKIQVPFFIQNDPTDTKHVKPVLAITSLSNYNELAKAANAGLITLQSGEAVVLPSDVKTSLIPQTVVFQNGKKPIKLNVRSLPHEPALFSVPDYSINLVVADAVYSQVNIGEEMSHGMFNAYNTAQWRNTVVLSEDFSHTLFQQENGALFTFGSRALNYFEVYQTPTIELFIGLFTAIIFLVASCAFLYFRFYTDVAELRVRYKSLAKIGLTESEMRSSTTLQATLFFFLPFVIATVNMLFAMVLLVHNTKNISPGMPIVETLGLFFVIQLIYFLGSRSQYLHQLMRA
jgi:putative ABC transport system permease protein